MSGYRAQGFGLSEWLAFGPSNEGAEIITNTILGGFLIVIIVYWGPIIQAPMGSR